MAQPRLVKLTAAEEKTCCEVYIEAAKGLIQEYTVTVEPFAGGKVLESKVKSILMGLQEQRLDTVTIGGGKEPFNALADKKLIKAIKEFPVTLRGYLKNAASILLPAIAHDSIGPADYNAGMSIEQLCKDWGTIVEAQITAPPRATRLLHVLDPETGRVIAPFEQHQLVAQILDNAVWQRPGGLGQTYAHLFAANSIPDALVALASCAALWALSEFETGKCRLRNFSCDISYLRSRQLMAYIVKVKQSAELRSLRT
ncbi:uncharacterized protein C8Q71DRAFT_728467 [Rhodofomes roseus]|uniref:DUF6532 domain-containing protein n=1 Tax=Rhodofomes roseus TaxID=34475 RepID=A0ABQ8JY08_9APHY|nr:uncharacterized protein C8Q71DRAFT_728467 [Rhodofomes roseus]KAH9828723.1 hypothetical protein C8Q71DRAFT_728467 [Rhodofomes roseus]